MITYMLVVSALTIQTQTVDEPLYATPYKSQAQCTKAAEKFNASAFKLRIAKCVPTIKESK